MELQKLNGEFSICKVESMAQLDNLGDIVFVAKTADETSIVCETAYVPPKCMAVDNGWSALKIMGILDFGLVGIVAKISNILADAKVSIFVVSTFNTDYILVKSENFEKASQALTGEGYTITTP